MAEFLNLEHLKGFDKDQIPRWQMAPFRESRYVQLLNGASLQVDGHPIEVTELSGLPFGGALDPRLRALHARYFRVTSWHYHGKVRIKAKDPSPTGRTRAELEVSVKIKKTVRINFLFVRDAAGHRTRRVPAGVPNWLSRINEIFLSQANIEVISDRVKWVTVNRDLGSVIRRTPGNDERRYVERHGWGYADMTFFMVWEYESDFETGVGFDQVRESTLGKTCFFEDEARPDTGATMAHEIGHFLGLRDSGRKNSLMYFYPEGRGAYLSREESDTINPTGIYRASVVSEPPYNAPGINEIHPTRRISTGAENRFSVCSITTLAHYSAKSWYSRPNYLKIQKSRGCQSSRSTRRSGRPGCQRHASIAFS